MYLVFNVGGTHLRAATSNDGVTLSNIEVVSTPPDAIGGCRLIKQLGEKLAGGERIELMAGGIAGIWDKDKKTLMKSPNLPGWEGKINLPNTYFENDAALEALGEATVGAGRRKSIMAYLCIGTGIGGCRTINGKIDERAIGFEPGKMIVSWNGKAGYLEELASGKAIEKLRRNSKLPIIEDKLWENEARLLSIALHNMTVMWSPEIIVLGGSVMQSVPLEKTRQYLKEELIIFPEPPEIAKSELGEKAGLYGALELIRQKLGHG